MLVRFLGDSCWTLALISIPARCRDGAALHLGLVGCQTERGFEGLH